MNSKTNTPDTTEVTNLSDPVIVTERVGEDLKNSILIVSVVANLFVLTAWIALQVTSQFDSQLASFLFTR
jgi:hypothetical protein